MLLSFVKILIIYSITSFWFFNYSITKHKHEHNTMYENYTTLPLLCYSTRDRRPPAQGVAVGTGAIEKKKK